METLINGMLNERTLLDLIRHFIVFGKSKKEDNETGITTIATVKKLAVYHQYGTVWKSSDFRNGQLDVQQRKRRED